MPHSWIQRMLYRFLPKQAPAWEAESHKWRLECKHCQHTQSFWEIGGIRVGAKSAGKWMYRRCAACGRISWQRVYYQADRQP